MSRDYRKLEKNHDPQLSFETKKLVVRLFLAGDPLSLASWKDRNPQIFCASAVNDAECRAASC